MKRKRRKPEVPEEEAPVEECLDGLARITSKEHAITHFVEKLAPSRMLVPQDQECLQIWGESALMHIARLTNSLAKGPERMVTKVQWPC